MAEGTENNIPKLPSSGNGNSGKKNNEKDILDSTGSKSAGDAVDDAKKKAKTAGKVAKTVGNIIQAIASIPVAGPIIIGIIILIIIIIGVYYFVTTIPGLAMGKLKDILQDGIDLVQSWFTTKADAEINPDDIAELANYLEELEYDLIGNGFIVPSSRTNSDYVTYEELIEDGYLYGLVDYNGDQAYRYYKEDGTITIYEGSYYNSLGVLIDNETGSIKSTGKNDGESIYIDKYGLERSTESISSNGQGEIRGTGNADVTLLRTYLLSDYRIYAIRNLDEGFGEKLYTAIKKTFGGYDAGWSKGLLKFYYATDGLATEAWGADIISKLTGETIDIGDAISIDADGKKMSLKKGYFNNAMEFNIDGWADRYGMSLEFLLSLHLATGAPDLVYAMLQSFDTEVQVYLNDSGGADVDTGYVDLIDDSATTSDMVTWDDLTAKLDEGKSDYGLNPFTSWVNGKKAVEWINGLVITKKTAQFLLSSDHGLFESPDNCLGTEWQTEKIELGTGTGDNGEDYNIANIDSDLSGILDDFSTATNNGSDPYLYTNEDGEESDFTTEKLVKNLGTDESNIYDDDNYSYFSSSDMNSYSDNANIDISELNDTTTIKIKENTDDKGDYTGNYVLVNAGTQFGTGYYKYNIYRIERKKVTRTWIAEVTNDDGTTENVQYEWTTYKYLIYQVYATNLNNDNTTEEFVAMPESSTSATVSYYEPDFKIVSNMEISENLVDTVVIEYVSRDKTDSELDSEGYDSESVIKCSAKSWDEQKKCCKNCRLYIEKLVAAMANIYDADYSFYTPYISRVLGSWFRDTYFVIPEEEDQAIKDYKSEASRSSAELTMINNSYGTSGSYVVVDEEYLAETEEYWTAYVMKKDENGADTDEYQLYYMEPNGTTSNITMEEFIADIKAYLNESDYTAEEWAALPDSCTSQTDAEAFGFVFVKKAKTRTADQISNASIGEKVVWSAYSFDSNGAATGWTKITDYEDNSKITAVYEQIEKNGGTVNNTDDGGFYYNITSTNTVTQTEDAQRSETNSTVKWLFKYRKYYIYDGTTDVALTIAADKEAVITAVVKYLSSNGIKTGTVASDLGKYGRSALRQTYASVSFQDSWYSSGTKISDDGYELAEQWLEWQLDMYYSGITNDYTGITLDDIEWTVEIDDDGDGTIDRTETRTGDPRDPDLIGTVNITKNSLNAFTILENTKTYAAEYAYRDFKELIVELNYFDKEDLSEKVDSVFTWVIPEISPAGGKVTSTSSIDESKIFYIGDSWMERLKNSGFAASDSSYFDSESGTNADDHNSNIEIPDDASCIVVAFGLNGTSEYEKTQEYIDELLANNPGKIVYVLKTSHVTSGYSYDNGTGSASDFNSKIDTFNEQMQSYCSSTSNCYFIDPTQNIVENNGNGYLKDEYADGTFHLNSDGVKQWYEDIISAISTGDSGDTVSSGWPLRPWDKQNIDYGALIESKGTYSYLRTKDYIDEYGYTTTDEENETYDEREGDDVENVDVDEIEEAIVIEDEITTTSDEEETLAVVESSSNETDISVSAESSETTTVDATDSVGDTSSTYMLEKATEDFTEMGWTTTMSIVNEWGSKINLNTISNYYEKNDESAYLSWLNSLGGIFSELAGDDNIGDGTGNALVDAEEYVYGLMYLVGFDYCAAHDSPSTRCTAFIDNDHSFFLSTYSSSGGNHHPASANCGHHTIDYCMLHYTMTTCCNYTVDKVYYKAGLMGGEGQPKSSCNVSDLKNNYGATEVYEISGLHLGDLIECYNSSGSWYHVMYVGYEDDDYIYVFYTGHDYTNTGDIYKKIAKTADKSEMPATSWVGLHIWDLDYTGSSTGFNGYEGGEMVASPVTGKVIEYGTHSRTNVYTGDTEEVGYITIKVLDSDELFTESNVTNNSNDFEASDEDAANGLNLFYEEYEDTCAGYIVTIDGFKLDMNAEDESGNYGMYEENEVVALYNSEEQEKRKANEESKYNAPFFVDIGGSDSIGSLPEEYTAADSDTGYYIKEGKYLGTTYTDEESAANVTVVAEAAISTETELTNESEYTGPANYMRIIVKDTDYSIVDNVEDFFDIPEIDESSNSTGEYGDLEAIDENSTDAEKVRAAVTYFKSIGFTTEAACGIVGNLIAESGLDTTLENPYGLCQWLSDRWSEVSSWIIDQGYNATSFAGQIRAIYEFEYNQMDSSLWDELMNLSDVEQAAELFMVYFERCPGTSSYCSQTYYYKIGDTYQLCRDRKIFAQNAYDIYMGDDSINIKDGSVGY